MKLLTNTLWTLLIFCSALWVSSSSEKQAPPPPCDSMLMFSLENPSLSDHWNSGDINRRSLSPWTWRSTTVKDRIPSTLWEADCSGPCSSPKLGQLDHHNMNSATIYQNILVLNRKEGEKCYTASFQSVAVGCTCIRPELNQQNPYQNQYLNTE